MVERDRRARLFRMEDARRQIQRQLDMIDRQITLGQFVASEIVVVLVMAGIEKLILSIATVYDALIAVEKAGHITDLPLERAGGRLLPDADPT